MPKPGFSDAERLHGRDAPRRFRTCDEGGQSRHILVNTCGLRQSGREESISAILAGQRQKASRKVSSRSFRPVRPGTGKVISRSGLLDRHIQTSELCRKWDSRAKTCNPERSRLNLGGLPPHAYLLKIASCNRRCVRHSEHRVPQASRPIDELVKGAGTRTRARKLHSCRTRRSSATERQRKAGRTELLQALCFH